jgi:hypothetical protein
MPPSFEWEIEDNSGPPRQLGDASGSAARRNRRRLFATALVVLLAFGGIAIRAWTAARDRAVEEARAELRASVELELASIAEADAELFHNRQDPENPMWQDRQSARMGFGIPGQETTAWTPAPGLSATDRAPEIGDIRVSGRRGQVQLTHWFEVRNPLSTEPGLMDAEVDLPPQPLPFRSTWFYRQGDDGVWYHVAPPDTFPGIPHSWYGNLLEIHSSELEAPLLGDSAVELVSLAALVCQVLDCAPETHYVLSFEDIVVATSIGERWALPAPHLVGLPEGAEARAAWQWSLKLWVFQNLVSSHTNLEEVTDSIILRQLVGRLAARAGLAEPFPTDRHLLLQASARNELHSFQELWQAGVNSNPARATRLLNAEIAALLDVLASQIGSDRLFELLPEPGVPFRASRAALFSSLDLGLHDITAAWSKYVAELTGEPVTSAGERQGEPPPAASLAPPPISSSNRIALVCGDRIWVGGVDGSDLVALTPDDEHFSTPTWSPDGRRLLTLWSPEGLGTESALYVFDLEQAEGSLLANSQARVIKTPRWNPDGSQVVFKDGTRFRAVDIETGNIHFLPATPVWSPSGEDLAYVAGSPSTVWLADAEWGNPRQVAEKAELWWDNAWSPDGGKLGLILHGDYPYGNSLAVYDLKTQSITPLFSIGDLMALSLTYDGRSVSDGTDPHHLVDRVQRWYQSFGWSSDSRKLLIWGQGTIGHIGSNEPTILASLPLNGSPPYVVAFGEGVFRGDIVWSPTDASRLVFTWQRTRVTGSVAESIVFDLDAGPLYTEQGARRTVWSPDGTRLAMIRADHVIVVDPDKEERLVLAPAGVCSDVAWNPAVAGTVLAPTSIAEQRTN